jgi:uncharacterized OB-fold protein
MRPKPARFWNGSGGRELSSSEDLDEEMVYCATCGNVFVPDYPRYCPACMLAETIEEMNADGTEIWR